MSDQRQYQRISLNVNGTLSHSGSAAPVVIEDISLQGLRLRANEAELGALPFDSHEPYHVEFLAHENHPLIEMFVEQLYRHADTREPTIAMGCKVHHIDVESLAALRRLLELNSGDSQFTEHDLDHLIESIYSRASSA
ncbi:PilZ domain-containing protein [Salinimonas chungwhensis]|uniref:PilZ domain-containing protein n=1 Tax=Salinimonas chungwhensis TaxID=265425 RepID=UPI00036F95F6|nr:PilZ domain-containing protein [Salinimonas chungwhensis]